MTLTKKQITITSLIICVVFTIIFNLSLNWMEGCPLWHKLFVALISFLMVIIVPFVVYKWIYLNNTIGLLLSKIISFFKNAIKYRKSILIVLIIYIFSCLLVYLINALILNDYLNIWQLLFVYGCVALIIAIGVIIRHQYKTNHKLKTESVFAILALIIGLTTIISSPKYISSTPDDDTHWARAASLVSIFDYVKYESENKMFNDYKANFNAIYNNSFEYKLLKNNGDELDNIYSRDNAMFINDILSKDVNRYVKTTDDNSKIEYITQGGTYSIVYITPAIAMIIAKGLFLPFSFVFMAGKIAILLTYIGIIYNAIRRIQYGKWLISIIALSPTSLYWACSYSYDWWVISWIILGYALYIGELQRINTTISNKKWLAIIICFALGVLPKWIYGILVLPLLFTPAKKFKNKKQRIVFYAFIAIVTIAIFIIFFLPIIQGHLGKGDPRAGIEVNAQSQLLYIISNPSAYTSTLFKFLLDYINPINASGYLTKIGYFGEGTLGLFTFIVILIAALMDRKKFEDKQYTKMTISYRLASLISVLIGLIGIITAFYLIYTPVASDTVLGCQSRYVLPLLFPFMYAIGIDDLKINNYTRKILPYTSFIMPIIYLITYYQAYISKL